MAITYSWQIDNLMVKPEADGLADVVVLVDWRRALVDGEWVASQYGQVSLAAPSAETFRAFADLTKSDVVAWVVAAMGAGVADNIDASLAADIARQKNPPVVQKKTPWSD